MDVASLSAIAPSALWSALGRCGRPVAVAHTLQPLRPQAGWFRTEISPYPVRLAAQGVDLMLQCINPDAPEPERLWGLNSWTSSTGSGTSTTFQDLAKVFGEPLLNVDRMAIFEAADEQGRKWCAHCQLDDRKSLQALTIMRQGAWLPFPEAGKAQTDAAPPPAVTQAPPPVEAPVAVTCKSYGTVPKTGWYEGRVPPDHRSHRYLSQAPGRFAYMKEGARMLSLGVVPLADEALVVWTWLREK